ncbi:MAG: nucleotidyltransferase domain-containing protein [Paracoccus sp. (in: a-proteobacteria)]|nr:nucleotidyltransferase domain-containing protein [Paracoccus sp. (in: a-proteobacteria)]
MSAVSAEMRAGICARLQDIARSEGVTILLAVESGSRAWGFHSPDSDYDVRFIYARPPEWHLRLEPGRDVIERPISGDLDISGWELSKALRLAMKSNAVLAEWLQSPITYLEDASARADLTGFAARVLDRRAVSWHYLSLAHRQSAQLRDPQGQVRLKRYFYCLRPALALRHMRLHGAAMVPMNMQALMAETELPAAVTPWLNDLIAVKQATGEMGVAAATNPDCDALIAHEVAAARDWLAAGPARRTEPDWTAANELHLRWSQQGA